MAEKIRFETKAVTLHDVFGNLRWVIIIPEEHEGKVNYGGSAFVEVAIKPIKKDKPDAKKAR